MLSFMCMTPAGRLEAARFVPDLTCEVDPEGNLKERCASGERSRVSCFLVHNPSPCKKTPPFRNPLTVIQTGARVLSRSMLLSNGTRVCR
jgi:hypothetical protein